MTRRTVLTVLVAGLVLTCAHSSSSPSSPSAVLQILGHFNGTEEGHIDVAPRTRMLYGSMILCLDKPGTVDVTAVTPIQPEHARVVEYGLRASPFWTHRGPGVGDAMGDLRHNHFPAGHLSTYVCNRKTGRASELGVVLEKLGAQSASISGFRISYVSGTQTGSLVYPLRIVLCSGHVAPASLPLQCAR